MMNPEKKNDEKNEKESKKEVKEDFPYGRVVTSRIYPNPSTWWQRIFLVFHEPMRMDIQAITKVFEKKQIDGTIARHWKVGNFFQWYNNFAYPFICQHHDMEESLLLPWIKKKGRHSRTYWIESQRIIDATQ